MLGAMKCNGNDEILTLHIPAEHTYTNKSEIRKTIGQVIRELQCTKAACERERFNSTGGI